MIDCPACGHLKIEVDALQRLRTRERGLADIFAARARQAPRGSQFVIEIRIGPKRPNVASYPRLVASVEERMPDQPAGR